MEDDMRAMLEKNDQLKAKIMTAKKMQARDASNLFEEPAEANPSTIIDGLDDDMKEMMKKNNRMKNKLRSSLTKKMEDKKISDLFEESVEADPTTTRIDELKAENEKLHKKIALLMAENDRAGRLQSRSVARERLKNTKNDDESDEINTLKLALNLLKDQNVALQMQALELIKTESQSQRYLMTNGPAITHMKNLQAKRPSKSTTPGFMSGFMSIDEDKISEGVGGTRFELHGDRKNKHNDHYDDDSFGFVSSAKKSERINSSKASLSLAHLEEDFVGTKYTPTDMVHIYMVTLRTMKEMLMKDEPIDLRSIDTLLKMGRDVKNGLPPSNVFIDLDEQIRSQLQGSTSPAINNASSTFDAKITSQLQGEASIKHHPVSSANSKFGEEAFDWGDPSPLQNTMSSLSFENYTEVDMDDIEPPSLGRLNSYKVALDDLQQALGSRRTKETERAMTDKISKLERQLRISQDRVREKMKKFNVSGAINKSIIDSATSLSLMDL